MTQARRALNHFGLGIQRGQTLTNGQATLWLSAQKGA